MVGGVVVSFISCGRNCEIKIFGYSRLLQSYIPKLKLDNLLFDYFLSFYCSMHGFSYWATTHSLAFLLTLLKKSPNSVWTLGFALHCLILMVMGQLERKEKKVGDSEEEKEVCRTLVLSTFFSFRSERFLSFFSISLASVLFIRSLCNFLFYFEVHSFHLQCKIVRHQTCKQKKLSKSISCDLGRVLILQNI